MPQKTPADHKAKDAPFKFTHNGKSYTLPDPTEHAEDIPGGITRAVIMNPDDTQAQLRMAFAMLDVANPSECARRALDEMPTKRMMEVIGGWMGESSGSSD